MVDQPITRAAIAKIAERQFGDMVKAVVDVERRVMAIGAELHGVESEQTRGRIREVIRFLVADA